MHKKQYDNWIFVHIIVVSILQIILSYCIIRCDQFTSVFIFENRNHRNIHETLNYSCGCTYSHKYFTGLYGYAINKILILKIITHPLVFFRDYRLYFRTKYERFYCKRNLTLRIMCTLGYRWIGPWAKDPWYQCSSLDSH